MTEQERVEGEEHEEEEIVLPEGIDETEMHIKEDEAKIFKKFLSKNKDKH